MQKVQVRCLCKRSLIPLPNKYSNSKMAVKTISEDENPFARLRISSWDPLKELNGRTECSECKRSRKYYCYTCYCLVGFQDPSLVPRVKLPVKVDILKHPLERDGKSTAVHARILAPDDVALTTVEAAKILRDSSWQPLATSDQSEASVSQSPWNSLERLVVIDSTWNGINAILKDERVMDLPCVKLGESDTHFWRPQRKQNSKHLATIEAIYYFFREMSELLEGQYCGVYDNLLYFYAFQYGVVRQAQKERLSDV